MAAESNVKLCDVCGSNPGAVGVMTVVNGRRRALALCESCATEAVQVSGGGFGPAAGFGLRAPGRAARGGERHDASETPALDGFGRDLTAEAEAGNIDPVIGREDEIEQTVEILARRRKNNAVLIGEAGVGKTAIAEGLALRIAQGEVPEPLRGARLVGLDLAGMVAGSQYRGQFEQRLKEALEEVVNADGRIVLFVDELHTVLGAGGPEGAMDAANILKPMLARGDLRMIGATTLAEFRKIERDAALARRFSPVTIEEPSIDDTVAILAGLRGAYEEHHGVAIADEAIVAAVRLSDRYITEYRLPDKAIDLIDQAAARVRLRTQGGEPARLRAQLERLQTEKDAAVAEEAYERAAELKGQIEQTKQRLAELAPKPVPQDGEPAAEATGEAAGVGEQDVAEVVALRTGIPVGELVEADLERLHTLEEDLHARVIGQDEAVAAVAETIRHSRAGLSDPDRPLGTFLFLGPTGVGKTELVKALAERLFATERALVRIDMSEYREPHTVARLIGSPPGYVGYGDGGQLTEPVRRRPYSVVLLDEIEKANPEVWNVLLQVMDDGRLTDGEGRTVDFTNTIVVMTSNLGSHRARRGVGFTQDHTAIADGREMLAAAKRAFLPEFLNRIDETIVFEALTAEQIEKIAGLVLKRVGDRLYAERGIELEIDPELTSRLGREGFDEEFGARPLKRHVRRTLERELTKAILEERITEGDRVRARDGADGAIALEVLEEVVQAAA